MSQQECLNRRFTAFRAYIWIMYGPTSEITQKTAREFIEIASRFDMYTRIVVEEKEKKGSIFFFCTTRRYMFGRLIQILGN